MLLNRRAECFRQHPTNECTAQVNHSYNGRTQHVESAVESLPMPLSCVPRIAVDTIDQRLACARAAVAAECRCKGNLGAIKRSRTVAPRISSTGTTFHFAGCASCDVRRRIERTSSKMTWRPLEDLRCTLGVIHRNSRKSRTVEAFSFNSLFASFCEYIHAFARVLDVRLSFP